MPCIDNISILYYLLGGGQVTCKIFKILLLLKIILFCHKISCIVELAHFEVITRALTDRPHVPEFWRMTSCMLLSDHRFDFAVFVVTGGV